MPGEGDAFTAKLLDFGIVKALDDTGSATRTGTTIGTPSYMAPEQLMGDKGISAQADPWSLAIVAYSALTGELPFAGETFGSVCLSIHAGAFVDATTRRPGLPAPLNEWFRRALRLAPDERFASAAEMAASFSAAAASGSLEQPQRLALVPGPTDSDALAFLRTRSMAPARRPRTVGVAGRRLAGGRRRAGARHAQLDGAGLEVRLVGRRAPWQNHRRCTGATRDHVRERWPAGDPGRGGARPGRGS